MMKTGINWEDDNKSKNDDNDGNDEKSNDGMNRYIFYVVPFSKRI